MILLYYTLAPSALGDVGIVWRQKDNNPSVVSVFLFDKGNRLDERVRQSFPGAIRRSHEIVDQLCTSVQEFLSGGQATFSEEIIDMDDYGEVQRKVLRWCMQIPKGRVSSYGHLAARSGIPKGARAVGRILAGNPCPIIIPCHRVIRADGDLCGFGGGLKMKKDLLHMEGIVFDSRGRVLPEFFW